MFQSGFPRLTQSPPTPLLPPGIQHRSVQVPLAYSLTLGSFSVVPSAHSLASPSSSVWDSATFHSRSPQLTHSPHPLPLPGTQQLSDLGPFNSLSHPFPLPAPCSSSSLGSLTQCHSGPGPLGSLTHCHSGLGPLGSLTCLTLFLRWSPATPQVQGSGPLGSLTHPNLFLAWDPVMLWCGSPRLTHSTSLLS